MHLGSAVCGVHRPKLHTTWQHKCIGGKYAAIAQDPDSFVDPILTDDCLYGAFGLNLDAQH